jgi:pantoate--beta-alanine ligase
MGEKDYQQLFLIKKYLAKKYKIKVVNCIIVRDKNKVALSTRNSLLSKKNYNKASLITKYLLNLKNKINRKRSDLSLLLEENIKILEDSYNIKIDYLELRNKKNLQKSNQKNKSRLFIAYYLDKVRLIDNF